MYFVNKPQADLRVVRLTGYARVNGNQAQGRHWKMSSGSSFLTKRRRPSVPVLIGIVLLHIALFYGLLRAFAPDFTAGVEETVTEAFTVTITAPMEEPETPDPQPEPDEGAQGGAGREAVPQPKAEPTPRIRTREDPPAPRATSTGTARTSGATDSGEGTGATGLGEGTGSGRGGAGQGGPPPQPVQASAPVLVQSISDSSLFPVPPGGRRARVGKSAVARLQVSSKGRVTSCRIIRTSGFPETDAALCRLAPANIRFEPARDTDGNAMASVFGYQQRFFN